MGESTAQNTHRIAPGEGTWAVYAEKLTEENDQLRAEVERLKARQHATDGTCGECAHPLYAENERLRAELELMRIEHRECAHCGAAMEPPEDPPYCFMCGHVDEENDRDWRDKVGSARAALKGEGISTREQLAEYAHEAWSGWMEYLFDKGHLTVDKTFIIEKESVERWRRQMMTKYTDLPENEKESDRLEADKMLVILHDSARATLEKKP